MKNSIQNQKGIALITILMLLVLGLAVVAILFRLATKETKLARIEQGYSTALDAAKGATDLFIFMIQNGFALATPPTAPFNATFNPNFSISCLQVKLQNATSSWTGAPWAGCPQANTSVAPSAISSNALDSYDMTFTLNGYAVYLKVIDNTTTQPVDQQNLPCYNGCFYYTVVTLAQPTAGAGQQADVTFVYRYDQ